MPPQITTRELEDHDYAAWEKLAVEASGGGPYALPEYLDALAEAAGGGYRILACDRDGELLGGIALYERSCWAGRYVTPRLLLYYNGFVLSDGPSRYPSQRSSTQLRVLQALEAGVRSLGYAQLRLHCRESLRDLRALTVRGWRARPSYSYLMRLEDLRDAWGRVEGNFRRLVRRCEEQGMRCERSGDFDSFFALHREIHERKNVPLYLPEPAFRRFYERLHRAGLVRLYHARDPVDKVVATQMVLAGAHPVTHTLCAGSAGDALRSGASVFLRWKVCEALAAEGFAANDLTDAELNPVTRFKSQLGGDLVDSYIVESPGSPAWRLRDTLIRSGRRAGRVVSRLRSRRVRKEGGA